MKTSWNTFLAAALAAALLWPALGRSAEAAPPRAVAGETPPGVSPGARLYWVQTRTPSLAVLNGTTPVEVQETRGPWALVECNGINFGPIWLNFDQVVHYKTKL